MSNIVKTNKRYYTKLVSLKIVKTVKNNNNNNNNLKSGPKCKEFEIHHTHPHKKKRWRSTLSQSITELRSEGKLLL
jgi:hypothetical protein